MNAIKFLSKIKASKLCLFHTREIAAMFDVSIHSAGKYLEALRAQNFVEKISRSRWAVIGPDFDLMQVAEFISAPNESYISLHTALFHYGMIAQVPSRIYSVTVDRSKVVKTPLGTFSFHHCDPKFFFGYEYIKPFLKIATPEKALVDYFYFAPTKSRQFTKLPELEFPNKFSWKKVDEYCDAVPSARNRSLVKSKIAGLR